MFLISPLVALSEVINNDSGLLEVVEVEAKWFFILIISFIPISYYDKDYSLILTDEEIRKNREKKKLKRRANLEKKNREELIKKEENKPKSSAMKRLDHSIAEKKREQQFSAILAQKDNDYKNIIDSMNGYDFERFVKVLFENMGYSVEPTSLSGDQGADLIVSKFGERTSVQVKRYSNNVSNHSVQEVVASKNYYNCDKCMVVTNSYFTNSAIELARANSVELISRDKLHSLIDTYI
jgi:HJR/Mrr/RecB family endonuclease